MNYNSKYNHCKGCSTFENRFQCLIYEYVTIHCPCINCLLKTMCNEGCDEFREVYRKYGVIKFDKKYNTITVSFKLPPLEKSKPLKIKRTDFS